MGTFNSDWIKKYYTVQGEANVYTPISFFSGADTVYITKPTLSTDKDSFTGGTLLSDWIQEVNTALGLGAGAGGSLKDWVIANYVPNTRKIAGVDLKDDITKAELLKALNVEDGANKYVHPSYTPTSADYAASGHSVTVHDLTIENGHIKAVSAAETLSHIVTGPGALQANHIVLGNGTDAVKDSGYSISNEDISDNTALIPTSHAVSKAITAAKAAGVEYKGTFTAWPTALPTNLSKGDFYKFTAPVAGSSETLPAGIHAGDIAIYNASGASTVAGNFDIIHSEMDKDTDTYYKMSISGHTITLAAQGSKAGDATQTVTVPDNNSAGLSWVEAEHAIKASVDGTKAIVPVATNAKLGLVKGGTTTGKTYGVSIDANGAMTVNVPWTDTNTNNYVNKAAFENDATNKNVKMTLTRNDGGTVSANIPAATTNTYGVTKLSDDYAAADSKVAASQKAVHDLSQTVNGKATAFAPTEFSGGAAGTDSAYSAVMVNGQGIVKKVGQFLVSAASTSDAALNNLAVGGFALIG
nr:MAG TPA: hypothetical protein [Caudoviricetes sp.]